jgi:hypothetical protein
MEMTKFYVGFVVTKPLDFIMESTLVKVARDSFDVPFNKRFSIDLAPKTNSAPFCELIAIDVNIVDLKNALLLE